MSLETLACSRVWGYCGDDYAGGDSIYMPRSFMDVSERGGWVADGYWLLRDVFE